MNTPDEPIMTETTRKLARRASQYRRESLGWLKQAIRADGDVTALLRRLDEIDADPHRAWLFADEVRALLGTDTTPDRLAWISEAGETAAAERQARYQETACARRPAEERPDA